MSDSTLSHSIYGLKKNSAVLLLHGFLGSNADWHEIATNLSADHFVIAVDLPGHGASVGKYAAHDYSMNGCSLLLIELLDALEIVRCAIVGYSMGGRLALYFALQCPKRCTALILESVSPGLRTEQERSARQASDTALTERLLNQPLDQFLADWYAQPLFESLRKCERFDEPFKRRLFNDPRSLALSLQQMGTGAQPTLWNELRKLKMPTLLLAGERDQKFTRIAEEMASTIPNAKLCLIENAGHTIHFESPERYIAEVRQFLRERK